MSLICALTFLPYALSDHVVPVKFEIGEGSLYYKNRSKFAGSCMTYKDVICWTS